VDVPCRDTLLEATHALSSHIYDLAPVDIVSLPHGLVSDAEGYIQSDEGLAASWLTIEHGQRAFGDEVLHQPLDGWETLDVIKAECGKGCDPISEFLCFLDELRQTFLVAASADPIGDIAFVIHRQFDHLDALGCPLEFGHHGSDMGITSLVIVRDDDDITPFEILSEAVSELASTTRIAGCHKAQIGQCVRVLFAFHDEDGLGGIVEDVWQTVGQGLSVAQTPHRFAINISALFESLWLKPQHLI